MNLYLTSFCSAARQTLEALLGFHPPWTLSGRAALWWRTAESDSVRQLSLVWYGRDSLGTLSRDVRARLAAADLKLTVLHSSPRRLWLAVSNTESACSLKLIAEPEGPLVRPWQTEFNGHLIYVASWRDILQTTLCSLCEGSNPEEAGDLFLLSRRRRGPSLKQGLLDAHRRNPGFDPHQLAAALASIGVRDVDLPQRDWADFRRFQKELVFRLMSHHEGGET